MAYVDLGVIDAIDLCFLFFLCYYYYFARFETIQMITIFQFLHSPSFHKTQPEGNKKEKQNFNF